MGTSGSYSGSGGKAGKELRKELTDWLDQLPPKPPDDSPPDEQPSNDTNGQQSPNDSVTTVQFPPNILQNLLPLLRPRVRGGGRGDGPGGGGVGRGGERRSSDRRTGGGPRRTAAASAGSAGKAAAAAYAYQTGNAAELERLGLRYDELRALGDPLEVISRIVVAACGPNESTIEDMEQRYVAAELAQWVFDQGPGAIPAPEEIVRKTISLIIVETLESETGDLLRDGKRPAWATELAENELRDAADALVQRASLSVDGVSATEFSAAIENGIETLRQILAGDG